MESMQPSLGARHSPLTLLVVKELRERILGGVIAAGERLVEGRLSAELGVSRMPVREALRQLAAEGLVTIEPRRGASVTRFSDHQMRELVVVRATLEGLNARLAAQRHDPQQITRLEQILSDGIRMADLNDPAALTTFNALFHDTLGEVAANSVLNELTRTLRDRTALLFAPLNRNRAAQNWLEHADILQAVTAGDAERASSLAAQHVYSAARMEP
jgi:DNA-binding GntR family transcriptional regulator